MLDNLEVALGEVATIVMGTSPKGTTYNHEGIGSPLLNGPTEFGEIHPRCTLYTTDSKKECQIGDLIFCVRGSTGRMNWADQTYSLGRGVCSIRGNSISDTKFIRYCIEWKLDGLLNLAGGSTFSNLTADTIRNFPIPYPASRRKIAAVIGTYDDLIANNTRRIKILEDMAQTLYREWFVHYRYPGHEDVPMVESTLGSIPQGWEIGELGDIAESVKRSIKPRDADAETPYFGLKHLPRKSIALSNWDVVAGVNSTSLAFKKGEILFGKIRPYFHKVGVAPLDGICTPSTIVIRPLKDEYFAITLGCVSSEHFIDYATAVSQGTTMPSVNWNVLVKYPVVIPPPAIARRFDALVRDVVDKIHNLIFQNKNLRETRDLLLPKLITGEVDVSELAIETDGMQPRMGGTQIPYPLTERLHSDENICGGQPVIKGTRITVEFILDLRLKHGWSTEEILENYPGIAREDIDACFAYQQRVTCASVSR